MNKVLRLIWKFIVACDAGWRITGFDFSSVTTKAPRHIVIIKHLFPRPTLQQDTAFLWYTHKVSRADLLHLLTIVPMASRYQGLAAA